MALPPPKRSEMGAFYLVFGPMELSARLGYTTHHHGPLGQARMPRRPVLGMGHVAPAPQRATALKATQSERAAPPQPRTAARSSSTLQQGRDDHGNGTTAPGSLRAAH